MIMILDNCVLVYVITYITNPIVAWESACTQAEESRVKVRTGSINSGGGSHLPLLLLCKHVSVLLRSFDAAHTASTQSHSLSGFCTINNYLVQSEPVTG